MQSVAARARTPLDPVNSRLVTTFLPYGFGLTVPVFEHLDNPALLAQEVQVDLAHGLVGKTAISRPDREQHSRVHHSDVEVGLRIMDGASPAVFMTHYSMCEVATHLAWAHRVVE